MRIVWLFVAGGVGTLARYTLSGFVQRLHQSMFPWGTLTVNALGCLLFGVVWTLAEERMVLSAETRGILLVGFMGGFTTFSSYAYETGALLRNADWMLAAANVVASNLMGVALFFAGTALGRAL